MRETLTTHPDAWRLVPGLLLTLLLTPAAPVAAQAWVAPKGLGTVSLSYQYSFMNHHYLADGTEADLGHVWSHLALISVSYSATDRLAVSFGVPYVVARYTGHLPHDQLVDGAGTHGTFQDYRMDLRYQLLNGKTAVTPFVEAIIPTHDYRFFGHSAVGKSLPENSVGVYVGRPIDEVLPNAYMQARLSYSFVNQEIDVKANHVNLDIDAGYFVSDSLAVRLLVSANQTDGGVDMNRLGPPFGLLFRHHDQILREDHVNVGAGVSYAMTDSTDVFLSALRTVRGSNGHKLDVSVTLGVAWSFSGPGTRPALRTALLDAR